MRGTDIKLVDIPTVQDRLGGIGKTFVYGMLQDGTLPSIKLGKRRLVLESELDRFIEQLREDQAE